MKKENLVVAVVVLFLGFAIAPSINAISGPFPDLDCDSDLTNNCISGGNTLITEYIGNRIIEIDTNGNIVWQITGLENPPDVERLENGNTLIVEAIGRVIEVDNGGAIVWQKTGLNEPYDAERLINRPPESPTITGEIRGQYGEEYEYTFVSTDPENQDVRYYIEWGDGNNSGWIGPYSSGQEITVNHTWDAEDTYIIRAKAKDIFDAESDWGYLEVTMPINQQSIHPFVQWLLDLFPNAFPILRQILEI